MSYTSYEIRKKLADAEKMLVSVKEEEVAAF